MTFIEKLNDMSSRVSSLKSSTTNEESTKTALIMPFIANVLGYDIFNPNEFVPEYTADVGIKKGEKVDYAILKDNKLQMIIECKSSTEKLSEKHINQLHRYFSATETRLAILTNGVQYKLFSDIENKNIMDTHPFLEFDITNLDDTIIDDIERITKEKFNLDNIINNAGELKYINQIIKKLNDNFNTPTEDFVKFIMTDIYTSIKTQKAIEQFSDITKKATDMFITNKISERLNVALGTSNIVIDEDKQVIENNTDSLDDTTKTDRDSRIITTEEELEGYYIVKSILRKHIDIDRICYRDTITYFSILLDNNNRKPICRLYFNTSNKYIEIIDKERNSNKYPINNLDDIFTFENELIENMKQYM